MKPVPFLDALNMVGSDPENFKCMYCGASDRERHLFMFFEKLKIWNRIPSFSILHFAPERNLSERIKSLNPVEYIKADLFPRDETIQKVDATDIPFGAGKFDLIICNHVLEHIPDYRKALQEIYRVLKAGGIAILQTPYSKLLVKNFDDENINSPELQLFFYGQRNHVRVFGEQQFFSDLESNGFELEIKRNDAFFTDTECIYYGVNKKEDLIMVRKPHSAGPVNVQP